MKVIATDYAAGMVEEARRRAQALNLQNMRCLCCAPALHQHAISLLLTCPSPTDSNFWNCSFEVADATNLQQFADGTFDGISCASGLFLFPDQPRYRYHMQRTVTGLHAMPVETAMDPRCSCGTGGK